MTEEEATVRAADLADEFGRTAKLLGARLASRLSHHDLSVPRAHLLVALLRHGPQRISQGTASTLADALVRDGLLERRADLRDGRATQLILTATGQERARAWLGDYEAAAREVFAALPPQQRPALLAALRTLSAASP